MFFSFHMRSDDLYAEEEKNSFNLRNINITVFDLEAREFSKRIQMLTTYIINYDMSIWVLNILDLIIKK